MFNTWIIITFFIAVNNLFPENSLIIKPVRLHVFKHNLSEINPSNYKIKIDDQNIFILSKIPDKLKNTAFITDLFKFSIDSSYNIKFKDSLKLELTPEFSRTNYEYKKIDPYFKSFIIRNDTMIVNMSDRIILLKKENSVFKYISTVKLISRVSDILMHSDNIIALSCYNRDYNISSQQSVVMKIGLSKRKLYQEVFYLENPVGFEWTNIRPRRLIDFCNNKVLLSDASQYRIKIYEDFNFDLPVIISCNRDGWWNFKKSDNTNDTSSNIKEGLFDLLDNMTKGSLINQVRFINDTTILVVWSNSTEEKNYTEVFFDICQLKNDEWGLVTSFKKSQPSPGDGFRLIDYQFDMNFEISGNYLISIQPLPFATLSEYEGTYEEINDKIEEYYFENDLIYSLVIYELKW